MDLFLSDNWDQAGIIVRFERHSIVLKEKVVAIWQKITSYSGVDFLSPDHQGYWILWLDYYRVSGSTSGYKEKESVLCFWPWRAL